MLLTRKTFSNGIFMKIISLVFVSWLTFFCCGITSAGPNQDEQWQLFADKTTASHDNQYLEAYGNVVLDRGRDYIRADYARFYQATKWVFLKGNIQAKFQGDFLMAEEAEFDLGTSTGWLKNGQVFMDNPHMYFSGEILRKTGPETYEFREATVTVCDGDRPAWSIKAIRGDITVDGYAHLWGPRFQILDQPVFASPYAVIPVKTKRQSGFLLPEIGSSNRLGATFDQPYYQVIDDNQDATLYAHVMSKKGLMLGSEYRVVPDVHSKGIVNFDYLFDQEIEETSLYSDNYNMDRTNRNRWWLRGKYDGYVTHPDWNLKIDLDIVSDADYLREFSRGYSGFKKSRKNYLQYFGRDIEDNDSKMRINRALLSHNWAHFGFQGLFEYTQNLEYGNNNRSYRKNSEDDPTLQRIPELNLHLYQTEIIGTPLTIEGTSQLASFWREYGTTGSRIDIYPVLGIPLHFQYGSIIPKFGARMTSYFIQRFENDHSNVDTENSVQSRFFPDFSTTAYSEFSKIFTINDESLVDKNFNQQKWLKLRHSLQPRIEYSYTTDVNQEKYPYFDEIDRIEPQNELKYSLTNIFTTKHGYWSPTSSDISNNQIQYKYNDLIRLRLEQTYDIREATRSHSTSKYPRRPFSDILTDLKTQISPWLYITNKTWFSSYLGIITEHEHSLTVQHNNVYARYSLDFLEKIDEYKREEQERQQIASYGLGLFINQAWSIGMLYRVDYESSTDLEKSITLRYDHQCFSAETTWSNTDEDTRFEFRIILAQLGSVGR